MWFQDVKKFFPTRTSWALVSTTAAFFFVLALLVVFDIYLDSGNSPFYQLAQRFLIGHVDLTNVLLGTKDYVDLGGKTYWPLGPFPAVLYLPFVVFGITTSDGLLIFLLTLATLRAGYLLARRIGYTTVDSLWVSCALIFASPMLGIVFAPRAHYLSHSVVVLCIVLALSEYFGKRRYVLIGLLYAIILATRATAVVSLLFFLIPVFINYKHEKIPSLVHTLAKLLVPIGATLIVLLWYNYARFGSFFEFGYGIQNLDSDLAVMRAAGMMSLVHVPTNLYYFLIAGPLPVTRGLSHDLVFPFITYSFWGIGLIYTAPYLFSLVWKRVVDRTNTLLWIASISTAIPIFLYYGVGPFQLGYRYALDFLPLVYCIFLRTLYVTDREIPLRFKFLFSTVFLFNFYLFLVRHLFILWDRLL